MKHLLYIFFLFFSFTSWAQNDRCFNAYNQQGQEVEVLCVGQQVRFQDCGDKVPDENEYYLFNYKKESPIPTPSSNIKTHTYTTPGRYRVLQIANYGGNTLTDTVSRVFEVREVPSPVFSTRSCANGTVSVDITESSFDSYTINFGDGQPPVSALPTSSTLYTYSAQGTYTITVIGNFIGGTCSGISTTEVITLPPAPQPFIHNLTVVQQAESGQIQLALQNMQPGYSYVVQQWQGNSFGTIDTLKNMTQTSLNYTLQNVNTTEGLQYLVKPVDVCNTSLPVSNKVSSIALEATSGNEQISLDWKSMPFTGTFEIYKNGSLFRTLPPSTQSFVDTDVSCGQPDEYEIRGVSSDGSLSVSARQEVQATSTTLPAAAYLFTTFDLNNNVLLNLELPQGETAQQVVLERSMEGASFQYLSQAPQATFTDENADLKQVCYRATYTNACGNTSATSNVSCPILLTAQKQNNGAAVLLTWTGYEGFPTNVRQYTVELLDESNNIVSSYTSTGNTYTDRALSDEQPLLRYRIRATSANGVAITYSNLVVVEQDLLLVVPSGFTPNGDGLNDIFTIKGRLYQSYTIKVYNSLGQVIYKGTEADAGWDGTYKGERVQTGAYAYEIIARNSFGTTKRRSGTITLLR
ncbi:gliding motility-associated C-terminal domain-containing protein [Pontibacter toksunensis]|uniref:Gliding motility-associated C-terminal domain-containing protein n=1 Tax=Pontibacter toksunensis TaxID=1332631 RepID=A0ABW6BNP3_9BACT